MPVTFDVADVSPSSENFYYQTASPADLLKSQYKSPKILKTNLEDQASILSASLNHGFVGTCLAAYNSHLHLSIRPDDLWLSITTSLTSYIDSHAEEMRSHFVTFQGKKELVVTSGGTFSTVDWPHLISQMCLLIDKNTNAETSSWLEVNFSTSTDVTRTVSKVVSMAAMKSYFKYKFCLMCGLPKVTLQGTREDYAEIRRRIDRMLEWKQPQLTQWHEVLSNVLQKFLDAFDGKVDKDFWNRIAATTGGGSGPTYLKGWIVTFAPWTDEGKFVLKEWKDIQKDGNYGKLDTQDIRYGVVECPVVINDNGNEMKTKFVGGFFGMKANEEKTLVEPVVAWAILDNSQPEQEQGDEDY